MIVVRMLISAGAAILAGLFGLIIGGIFDAITHAPVGVGVAFGIATAVLTFVVGMTNTAKKR